MYEQSVPDKESINFKKIINTLCCMFICAWMAIPFVRVHTGVNLLLLFFLVWFITTDLKWLSEKWSWNIIFIFIFFITFVPYYLFGDFSYGIYGSNIILVNFPLFFLGMILNHYLMYFKKDYKTLGKIAMFCIIAYLIGSLQTYLGLLSYPMASRELAGAVSKFPELRALYNRLGIGGFGHVNSALFIFLAATFLVSKKESKLALRYRLVSLLSIIIILLMIIQASYTITIIMAFIGIILILVSQNRKIFSLVSYISIFLFILLPQRIIGNLLLFIADYFSDNEILYLKFSLLANNLIYGGTLSDTTSRIDLYLTSLGTWVRQPLFGIYGPFGDASDVSYSTIGGHSGWLDLLAFYGLFTGVPLFLAIFFCIKRNTKFFRNTKYYRYIYVVYFFFIIYGFLNPVISVYEIGFSVFFVVPSIPFIPLVFNNKASLQKEAM